MQYILTLFVQYYRLKTWFKQSFSSTAKCGYYIETDPLRYSTCLATCMQSGDHSRWLDWSMQPHQAAVRARLVMVHLTHGHKPGMAWQHGHARTEAGENMLGSSLPAPNNPSYFRCEIPWASPARPDQTGPTNKIEMDRREDIAAGLDRSVSSIRWIEKGTHLITDLRSVG